MIYSRTEPTLIDVGSTKSRKTRRQMCVAFRSSCMLKFTHRFVQPQTILTATFSYVAELSASWQHWVLHETLQPEENRKWDWLNKKTRTVSINKEKKTAEKTNYHISQCFEGTPTKCQVSKRQVSKRLVSKRLVSKRQVYKTSGLQNVRFQTSGFKTSSF